MNQFENIEQYQEYAAVLRDVIKTLSISDEEMACLTDFVNLFDKMLEDRKCMFAYLSIIRDSFRRMSSMIGAEWDEQLLASMNKTLGDTDENDNSGA